MNFLYLFFLLSSILPDPILTPGVALPVTKEQVCVPGYSSHVRNVSNKEKDSVYKEYGIVSHKPGEYEVDHLISLELGGSNDIKNLWPESYLIPLGAHEKDRVEDELHRLVCTNKLSLDSAQKLIKTDWTKALTN